MKETFIQDKQLLASRPQSIAKTKVTMSLVRRITVGCGLRIATTPSTSTASTARAIGTTSATRTTATALPLALVSGSLSDFIPI